MLRVGDARVPIQNRRRVLVVLGASLLLAITFVFLKVLLRTPTRTPLLIVSTTYAPPWDINPWEPENTKAIRSLDRHNLTVKSLEDAGRLALGQWSEFEDKIAQMDHVASPDKPFLLYINMHGVVDRDQRPCLLVHDSKPLDSSTWLPLQVLIDHTANAMKHNRPIVIFLESGRQVEPLPHEQGESHFVSAVRKLVESSASSSRRRRVAVLASTSTKFLSIDPSDGGSDPFTRFLVEGLSGESNAKSSRTNSTNDVNLVALHEFIDDRTKDFGTRHRGFPQTTFFCDSESSPLSVVWAGSTRSFPAKPMSVAASAQSITEIENAWRELEALRGSAPWHDAPASWESLLEHAVAMELAAFSGPETAKRFLELKRGFEQLRDELVARNATQAVEGTVDQTGMRLDASISSALARGWRRLAEDPTLGNAVRIVEESHDPGSLMRYCERVVCPRGHGCEVWFYPCRESRTLADEQDLVDGIAIAKFRFRSDDVDSLPVGRFIARFGSRSF
jgi:hypothetical protein